MGFNGDLQLALIIGCVLAYCLQVAICQNSTQDFVTTETTPSLDFNSTEDNLLSDQDVQVRVAPPDPTRRCDVIYGDVTFTVTSVNYPRLYDNNLDCKYRVNKLSNNYCRLELIFREFNVEPTPGCVADYFLVENDRFCGFFPPGTRRVYSFDEADGELQLQFRSNAYAVGPGYLIDGRQLLCDGTIIPGGGCDQTFTQPSFVLRSVNFPANYDNNLDCTYTIQKSSPAVCSVRLTFVVFELETTVDCNYDYLQIGLERICFFPPGGTRLVNFATSEIRLYFHSDEATTRRGFDIRAQQIPCGGGAGPIPGPIPAPIPGPIQPFPGPIPPIPGPIQPFPGPIQPIPAPIPGPIAPGPQPLPPPPPFPPFPPFPPQVPQVPFPPPPTAPQLPFPPVASNCRTFYTTSEFDITSPPMYPLPYGSPAIDCSYSVRKINPDICRLQLTFRSFNLSPSQGCSTDYLLVDGERLCGTYSQGTIRSFDFPSNELEFRLHSESQSASNGYTLTARQMACSDGSLQPDGSNTRFCNNEFTAELFTLASPNYPGPYPPALHCNYRVVKSSPDVCLLQLRINAFDLEADQGCTGDYLSINGQRLCGRYQPGTTRVFPFNEDDTTITFQTDNTGGYSGFYVDIMQQRCGSGGMSNNGQDLFPGLRPRPAPSPQSPQPSSTSCGAIHQTASEMVLVSPGYPDSYSNNLDCTYSFRKFDATSCQLSVTFQFFDVESSPACAYDYLQIAGRRICGQLQQGATENFMFNSPEFTVKFLSDAATTGRGFYMTGREVPCGYGQLPQLDPANEPLGPIPQSTMQNNVPIVLPPRRPASTPQKESCNQRFAARVFRIISPAYPMAYANGLDCVYTILKSSDSVCQLQVQMAAFDVEYHPDCLSDFLLIGSLRVCGYFPSGTSRNFDFAGSETTFRFVTNNDIARSGFVLDIIQTECGDRDPSRVPLGPDPRIPGYPEVCGRALHGAVETLSSENFPQQYANNLRCVYNLRKSAPDICSVDVNFQILQIEDSLQCSKDYILIGGERLCDTLLQGTIRRYDFPLDTFTIQFQSDNSGSDRGFQLQLTQVPCLEGGIIQRSFSHQSLATIPPGQSNVMSSCNITISTDTFSILSPSYPLMYPNNVDCTYTILKANPSVCSLWLDFVLFDVELSASCQHDYFDVDGEKLCGALPDNTPRIVAFTRDWLTMRFHSNDRYNRVGFYIQGQQHFCNYPTLETNGRVFRRSKALGSNSTKAALPVATTPNSTDTTATTEIANLTAAIFEIANFTTEATTLEMNTTDNL